MAHQMTKAIFTLVAVLAVAAPAFAQIFTGRIDVRVTDSSGAALPGVAVEVSGPQRQTATADKLGQAHLLNLASGTYQLKASLQGFSDYLNRALPVSAGRTIPLEIALGIQGVQVQVQVSHDLPIIEPN